MKLVGVCISSGDECDADEVCFLIYKTYSYSFLLSLIRVERGEVDGVYSP